jgi:ABC-type nickel/cobalt efflux system permease component RcnA
VGQRIHVRRAFLIYGVVHAVGAGRGKTIISS